MPEGWALDASGNPTTDPAAAMKGAMLAFGGQRGANIALMVEVLAAGISGANWSPRCAPHSPVAKTAPAQASSFSPSSPSSLDPESRAAHEDQLDRLRRRYGVHIPGRSRAEAAEKAKARGITTCQGGGAAHFEFAERYSSLIFPVRMNRFPA
ncbi:Ldh family oxidoreductase [Mesorhizobium atlanticum]